MNNAFAMLWTILFFCLIVFFYFGLRALFVAPTIQNEYIALNTECAPPPQTITQISPQNSQICSDGNYYLNSLGMIVSTNQVPYINACLSACKSGYTSNLDSCLDPFEDQKYQQCLELSRPVGCSSLSNPIGFFNSEYYYVNYVGEC